MSLTIAVVMCTYNGHGYLRDQLRSVLAQTRLPDTLVIVDDDSADDTPDIIESSLSSAPFQVRFFRNANNMGVVHAFERAISLADTDVLLLADQDDVWHRTKVEKYGALFEADDSVGAAFSDGEVVDENLRPLGYSLWECFQFTKRRRQLVSAGAAFAALLQKECVTGATLGFRRAHTRAVLPVPDGWMHDNWIALTAAAITTVAILPEQLIQYRQHKHNLEGAPRWSLWQNVKHACSNSKEVWPVVNKYQELARRLKSLEGVHESRLFEVDGKVRHLTRRATLSPYAMRRSVQIAHELIAGRYSRYSNGYRSAIVDLL